MSRRSVGRWVVAGLAVGLLGLGGCQDRSAQQQEGTGGAGMEGQTQPYDPAAGGVNQEQPGTSTMGESQSDPAMQPSSDPAMQPSTGGSGQVGSEVESGQGGSGTIQEGTTPEENIEQPSGAQEPATDPAMGGSGQEQQENIGGSGQLEPESAGGRDGGTR